MFRAGDVVKHRPTGETWVLAYFEAGRDEGMPCGWPPCYAAGADLELVEAAGDEQHREMLEKWAQAREACGGDWRARVCREQLFELNRGFVGAHI